MSYEPTLLLKHSDLTTFTEQIENWYDTSEVMKYLAPYVRRDYLPIKLWDNTYIILSPEFTSFNEEVRDQLTEWWIDYWIEW